MIPSTTTVALKTGMTGVVVWALQKALDDLYGITVSPDGDFGSLTLAAVKKFQDSVDLTADGVAGPLTQRALVQAHVATTEEDYSLPRGLLEGFAAAEGGWLLGAVNWTVAGGVDCGVFQRRVYSADYADAAVVRRAFDVRYQARLLASNLTSLRGIFISRAGTNDGTMNANEKAWRLAALNHNYPSGADTLSRTPVTQLSAYWRTPQEWVVNVGAKFPDGRSVTTPLEWTHLYAGLFAPSHGWNGGVTRYVTSWTSLTGVTWTTGHV
jgi:hypothetical protein